VTSHHHFNLTDKVTIIEFERMGRD